MAEAFDPYLKWLGIRKKTNRRVNHYRLLGVELFESDVDVLANAAERQIRHVESFATSEHREDCERIISEIRKARDCLLDPNSRQQYDRKLERKIERRRAAGQNQSKSDQFAAGDQQLSVNIDLPSNEPVDGSPNFDFSDQVATGTPSRSAGPVIKSRGNQSRRRKRPGFDWAGWVLGGIGAVAFAWVLVNTDLVDRIKGRVASDEIADNDLGQDSDSAGSSQTENSISKRNSDSSEPEMGRGRLTVTREGSVASPNGKSEPVPNSSDSQTSESNDSKLPVIDSDVPDSAPNRKTDAPETRRPVRSPTRSAKSSRSISVEPKAIPSESDIAKAMEAVRSAHEPELKGKDLVAKKILARRLYSNSSRQKTPALQYVTLQLATELASEVGELETLVSANKQLARKFKIDYWEELEEPANDAIGSVESVETIAEELRDLLDQAYSNGKFTIASRLANQAAKVARGEGDRLQSDMLVTFSKDMKSLEALRRKVETIESKPDQDELSTKDKKMLGEYHCFGIGKWTDGLKFLGEGSDRTLAMVAKTDLNAGDDQSARIEVAEAWMKLSKKSKYKGYQRRGMLRRAEQKIEESNRSHPSVDEMFTAIRMITQPVKLFVAPSTNTTSKNIVFDVKGSATFDSASLTGGRSLRLGLGNRSRMLSTRRATGAGAGSGGYEATTKDGNLRFLIRWLDTGIVEMRVYDNVSNQLQNIFYGKEM